MMFSFTAEMVVSFEKPEELVFTENETNSSKLYGVDSYTQYTKDAFHRYIINGM